MKTKAFVALTATIVAAVTGASVRAQPSDINTCYASDNCQGGYDPDQQLNLYLYQHPTVAVLLEDLGLGSFDGYTFHHEDDDPIEKCLTLCVVHADQFSRNCVAAFVKTDYDEDTANTLCAPLKKRRLERCTDKCGPTDTPAGL